MDKIEKPIQWYFCPGENIRLLRYFPLHTQIPADEEYLPIKNKQVDLGIVLNCSEDFNQVLTQIQTLTLLVGADHLFVYDNNSKYSEQIKLICQENNIAFYNPPEKLWSQPDIGDLSELDILIQGLKWADTNNLTEIIKIDTDISINKQFIDNYINTISNNWAGVYSKFDPHISSKFIGLNVEVWLKNYPQYCLQWQLVNEYTVLFYIWFTQLCKNMDKNNYTFIYDLTQEEWFKNENCYSLL